MNSTGSILKPLKVLLVEDSKTDAILITKALVQTTPDAYKVHHVPNLAAGLHALGHEVFDVVLLDLSLPDVSEFNGLLSIQNVAPKLPVIILTAHEDDDTALRAVAHGAQDYLFKDKVNGQTIKRAMRYAFERKQFEATLIVRAYFDPLTELANRPLFESRLESALARQKRHEDGLGVLFLDLDGFKQVNDTLGHAAGDQLLKHMADVLKGSVRSYDTVARFGGDEFAIIIEGIKDAQNCSIVAEKIIQKFSQPFSISGHAVTAGVSIGIATCMTGDNLLAAEFIRRADEAMYKAKLAQHSDFQFYNAISA